MGEQEKFSVNILGLPKKFYSPAEKPNALPSSEVVCSPGPIELNQRRLIISKNLEVREGPS